MKTAFLSLLLVCFVGTIQSQVIPLDPATVTFQKVKTSSNLDFITIDVKESFANQFAKDPIRFIEQNFSLASLDLEDYEELEVKFKTRKGFLLATYNNRGELMETYQRFKNIPLPRDIWMEIYRDNVGWSMLNNHYTASGKLNRLDHQKYTVKLVNGKEVKRVKFIPGQRQDGRVVSN